MTSNVAEGTRASDTPTGVAGVAKKQRRAMRGGTTRTAKEYDADERQGYKATTTNTAAGGVVALMPGGICSTGQANDLGEESRHRQNQITASLDANNTQWVHAHTHLGKSLSRCQLRRDCFEDREGEKVLPSS